MNPPRGAAPSSPRTEDADARDARGRPRGPPPPGAPAGARAVLAGATHRNFTGWVRGGSSGSAPVLAPLSSGPLLASNTSSSTSPSWRSRTAGKHTGVRAACVATNDCVASVIGWRTEVRRGVVAMAQGFGVGIASGTQRTTLLIPTLLDRAHGKVAARQRWRNHATSTRHCAAATDSSA
eukprot:COSAG02_NODE_583_length_20010_cov_4.434584_10_plen_180_part_00